MALLRFKMLHQEGTNKYFPYSPVLAEKEGMKVIEMTRKQIAAVSGVSGQKPTASPGEEVSVKPVKKERMKGWVKNHLGKWKRKEPKVPKKRIQNEPSGNS